MLFKNLFFPLLSNFSLKLVDGAEKVTVCIRAGMSDLWWARQAVRTEQRGRSAGQRTGQRGESES